MTAATAKKSKTQSIITPEQLEAAEAELGQKAPSRSKGAKQLETDDELLRTSLSYHGELIRMHVEGATDDELLVEINRRWRMAPVKTKRPYCVKVGDPNWGTAIWFDTIKPSGPPNLCHSERCEDLLPEVRRVLEIGQESAPQDISAEKFEQLRAKGKSRTKEPAAVEQLTISTQVEKRPIAWFKKSPFDTRANRPTDWVNELADSLKRDGQLQPCLARPDGQHIAGWTRVEAAKVAGLKSLDVRIVHCDDTTARRLVLIENAKRRDLTEKEKCAAYCVLLDEYKSAGRTQKELAADLGINESTLSNNVRLKSLPPEIWERHHAGGLGIDQIRKLAVHAHRPLFVKGFIGHLQNIGCSELEAMPSSHQFTSSYDRGIDSAFRTMKPDAYMGGCRFKPTPEQRAELDIVEIERWGRVVEMAANVPLWNKLNAAAKKAEKERKDKRAAKSSGSQANSYEQSISKREREWALKDAWNRARCKAICAKFPAAKVKKAEVWRLIRVAMAGLSYCYGGDLQESGIFGNEEDFIEQCREVVHGSFDPGDCDVSDDCLLHTIDFLGVDPAEFWKPTDRLLRTCSAPELESFAAECGINDGSANDLVERIIEKWPVGQIPSQFCLEKPSRKKGAANDAE